MDGARTGAWYFAVAAVAAAIGGCNSFLFVEGPPPEYQRGRHFECTKSYFWPVADMVASGSMLAASGLVATQSNVEAKNGRVAMMGLLAVAAVAGISAGVGYANVSACRNALVVRYD